MTVTFGSLFAGIGGIDLALESFGCRAAWQVENDKHAAAVLARHWPDVPNLVDVTAVAWEGVEPVDVICGGFPCQDISLAGKGAGIVEGSRSGLWSHFADAISVLRPRYVLIENVSALALRGLDRVLCDLAKIGFDAEWTCVRASDVGAPHRRDRIFVLATNANSIGWEGRPGSGRKPAGRRQLADSRFAASDADSHALRQQSEPELRSGGAPLAGWGDYEPAIRRWAGCTRQAPAPTDARGRLAVSFVEWMMGFPEGWVDGIPRGQQLKCLGNAVVPPQAAEAVRRLAA